MSLPPLKLLAWSAWAPPLVNREAWLAWLNGTTLGEDVARAPANAHVPPMLRRRCSLSSRMVLEVAETVCRETGSDPSELHLVYATANGEIPALKTLLESLSVDEPLSPTAFTNCVHHVPTGFQGIIHQHLTVSRTVSAFEDSFVSAWLDLQCLLHRLPDRPGLLVMADEVPPAPFDQMLAVPPFSYGLAILVAVADDRPGALRFSRARPDLARSPRRYEEPQFDFLRWFEGDDPALCMETAFGAVTWEKL